MRRPAIEELLPALFRSAAEAEDGVVGALLDAMEALHAPALDVLDRLDAFFDPRRAPDAFVPFLGRWVDLDRFYDRSFRTGRESVQSPITPGLGHLRELVGRAAYLSRWRGTRRGLIAFLETATGVSGFDVCDQVPDDRGAPRPFHLRVDVPVGAQPHIALVERIVASEKPAYVTYETRTIPQEEQ